MTVIGCSNKGKVLTMVVDFMTEDSIDLKGTLYYMEKEEALPGVILCHMFQNNRKSWDGYAKKLTKEGYVVLTFDFRDWGESSGTVADIPNHYKDVIAAEKYLSQFKMVDYNKIASAGAFIGGMASIEAAAVDTSIKAVVAFSTPHGWQGSEPMEVVGKISPRPVLIIAADDDPHVTVRSAQQNFLHAGEPREWKIIHSNRHGTDILYTDKGKELEDLITEFLNRKLKNKSESVTQ